MEMITEDTTSPDKVTESCSEPPASTQDVSSKKKFQYFEDDGTLDLLRLSCDREMVSLFN